MNEEAHEALQEHLDILAWICKACKGKMKDGKGNLVTSSDSVQGKIEELADMVKQQMRVIKKSSDE